MKITVPSSLRHIKLSQWQKYAAILDKNKGEESSDFLNLKTLEIFCGMDLKDIHSIPLREFDEVLMYMSDIFKMKTPRENTFWLKGTDGVEVEFGMIPNFDKMSYGEYEDLENYIFDEKNLHKAMAVLYRPVKFKKKDRYLIHDYEGTEFMAEVMKNTPLDIVFGARVFFYSLAKKLGIYTLDYTLQQLTKQQENHSDNPLDKNGEDTKLFIHSQMEMLKELTKLQDFHFTNV